jgi:transcription elongation GreA/GreB family factor
MSRAFVKELEGIEEELPARPQSPHPNYITPQGFRRLQVRLQELLKRREQLQAQDEDLTAKSQLKQVERDLRYLQANLERALIVDPAQQSHADIRFGARVRLIDENDKTHEFTIVGEEESCAPKGYISWLSPIAQALLGKQSGDTVIWERPMGNAELAILSFGYAQD